MSVLRYVLIKSCNFDGAGNFMRVPASWDFYEHGSSTTIRAAQHKIWYANFTQNDENVIRYVHISRIFKTMIKSGVIFN